MAIATHKEIVEVLNRQAELISKLGDKAKSYEYIINSLYSRHKVFFEQEERLISEIQSGKLSAEEVVEKSREFHDVFIKRRLMSDILCFIEAALKEEVGDECSK